MTGAEISAIADVIQALAAVVVCITAIAGFDAWKKEFAGQRRFDEAIEVCNKSRQLRESLLEFQLNCKKLSEVAIPESPNSMEALGRELTENSLKGSMGSVELEANDMIKLLKRARSIFGIDFSDEVKQIEFEVISLKAVSRIPLAEQILTHLDPSRARSEFEKHNRELANYANGETIPRLERLLNGIEEQLTPHLLLG